MHLDVLDLRNFYYRTGLGRAAQKATRDQILRLWPEAKGQTVVGFGFAVPLLRPYLDEARRVIGLMPAPQGVMPWPAGLPNLCVLTDEAQWPLTTGMVDKLVILHGLETSENPGAVLKEAWRVLGPGGRALIVVPARAGLWARRDVTPFGFGRPYSMSQLESQLREYGFTPERQLSALYAPPSRRRFWLRTAPFWESIGSSMAPWLVGGVLILEVSKQVFARRPPGLREVVRRPLRVLEGLPVPGVGSVRHAAPEAAAPGARPGLDSVVPRALPKRARDGADDVAGAGSPRGIAAGMPVSAIPRNQRPRAADMAKKAAPESRPVVAVGKESAKALNLGAPMVTGS